MSFLLFLIRSSNALPAHRQRADKPTLPCGHASREGTRTKGAPRSDGVCSFEQAAGIRRNVHRPKLPHRPGYVIRAALLLFVFALALIPAEAAKARKDADRAPSSSSSFSASDFAAFGLIAERNIFDPNRTGRARVAVEQLPPRVETIALVGIMETENRRLAFFDSPDLEYQKVVEEGESIGGLKVARILTNAVQLAADESRPFALRMNQQLRRVEGGTWRPGPRETRTEVSFAAGSSSMPPIPPGASEVLRRLMEQRQRQLKQ